jgi:hypothetical protein
MDFDFVAVATIVGALLPLVISFFKQAGWSNQAKKVFAMVVSVLAAVIMTGGTEGWDMLTWQNLIASSGVIIALAQTTYLGFWEDGPVESRVATLLYK